MMVKTSIEQLSIKNPPKHLAECFQTIINEAEFTNQFKKITFAIFDDHNAHKAHNPEGNVKPFKDIFGDGNSGEN